MKKSLLILTIIGCIMICLSGCRSQVSIQEEIDAVEATYQEMQGKDTSNYSQIEMNADSFERFKLWDDELNALWTKIEDTLDDSAYASLLEEQRAWIDRKELHVRASGSEAYGGSLQPCLENNAAADITRVRCYDLAKVLADFRGEQFSSYVVESLRDYVDPSYDDVMWGFRGPYDLTSYDGSTGELMISHENDEWEAIITYNGERKEVEVWGYNSERIIWESSDGDFFEVGSSWEGGMEFTFRDDIKEFLKSINSN